MNILISNIAGPVFVRCAVIMLALSVGSLTGFAANPLAPSQQAAQLDAQIDWSQARLIAVQDGGRYKTLESFARESFSAMTGREHLPGLSPLASLLEWLFHREAYVDTALIKIPNNGVLASLVSLATIVTPLVMTQVFAQFSGTSAKIYAPGSPFLLSAAIMVGAILVFLHSRRRV